MPHARARLLFGVRVGVTGLSTCLFLKFTTSIDRTHQLLPEVLKLVCRGLLCTVLCNRSLFVPLRDTTPFLDRCLHVFTENA